MCGVSKIDPIDAEYLIAPAKFAALISRSAGEYKRNEDTFAVFSADDIEAQARSAFLQRYASYFSVWSEPAKRGSKKVLIRKSVPQKNSFD